MSAVVLLSAVCVYFPAYASPPPEPIIQQDGKISLKILSKRLSPPRLELKLNDADPCIKLSKARLLHPYEQGGGLVAAGIIAIPFDDNIRRHIPRIREGESCDKTTQRMSDIATGKFLFPMVGGMYIFGNRENRKAAGMVLMAVGTAGLAVRGFKYSMGRGRPDLEDGAGEFDGPSKEIKHDSFPSGHTATAFAAATVLAKRDRPSSLIYYAAASAVAYSRLRKNAHYPSDVLVGAGIGMRSANRDSVQEIVTFTKKF